MSAPAGRERVLLTYCDAATGERTELTAAELGGWAARTAGLLHDGCGLGAGSTAAVLLPAHWQTAAVLLGAWSIGVEVSFQPWSTAGLTPTGAAPGFDAVFVSRQRAESWLETVPAAPHRFVLLHHAEGLAGYRDFLAEASAYTDALPAYAKVRSTDAATVDGTTYGNLGSIAQELAALLDLRPSDRLFVDATTEEQPLKWLLAPLSAGASIVLYANVDPAERERLVRAEGATRVM
jgi:uncharacterized protein (TIGR03089 family)